MENDNSDFSNEIWEVGDKLTAIMDRIKDKLKKKDNFRIRKCLKALAKAQGQLLKAFFTFDPSYKIPPEAGETWEHFLAKNYLIKGLPPQHIFAEFGLGGCVFDVLAKIGEEYAIMEAETNPGKCVEKARKIKTTIADFVSKKLETSELDSSLVLSEIREQLEGRKPLRLIFVVTRKPNTSTLKDIKKEADALIHPEVYYVNKIPPFKKSSNLLEKIQI